MATPVVPIEAKDFSTKDPEAAREFLSRAFGEATLHVKDPLKDNEVISVRRVEAPELHFSRLTVPSEMAATYAGRENEVLISSVTDGAVCIERGPSEPEPARRYGVGDVFIANCPGTHWRHENVPLANVAVGLSTTLLRETARPSRDSPPPPWRPLSYEPRPGHAAMWRKVAGLLHGVLDEPATAASPLVIGPAGRLAAAAVLTIFPNTMVSDTTVSDRRDAHPQTLRRAIAFIDANPQMDISAADLAQAAHASPRAVQLAFRRQLDTTPTAYLRSVRLQHAREDLLAASPGDKVADVALRWGFGGPSRFAEYYRREFGEKPSETLRR